MTDIEWKTFFEVCAITLGTGSYRASESETWCTWTTFQRVNEDIHYWTSGLPNLDELEPTWIKDGGTWGQPFRYQEIAHIVIPSAFSWESKEGETWQMGKKLQNIEKLSHALTKAKIAHRKTGVIVEIKLY
jgi:hypothetical protein